MQLRQVKIHPEKGINSVIQIAAPLWQWIGLFGLTEEEWITEFGGDVFAFIKEMNKRIGIGKEEENDK